MPQPDEVSRLAEQLIALFRDADAEITRLAAEAATMPDGARRRARLAEMRRTVEANLAQLEDDARSWLAGEFPAVYGMGGDQGARSIGDEFSWTQIHVDAVQRLADDTFSDVLAATGLVRDDVKAWVREQARRQTGLSLIEGRTAQQAARELAKAAAGDAVDILGGPIGVIRYADGSYRTMADYADMLLRTKTAQAFNAGTLNTLTAAGVEWCEVLDGMGCGWTSHADGDKANGTVRRAKDCYEHSLSHPRCRRSFIGRLDVTSKEQAAQAKPSTTPGQDLDQAAAEKRRAEGLANRRKARERAKRTQRTGRTPRPARKPRATRSSQPPARQRGAPPGTRQPVDLLEFPTGKASRFRGVAEQLGELHGAPVDNLPSTVITTGSASYKGGHFAPAKRFKRPRRKRGESTQEWIDRVNAARAAHPKTMEIRVNDRKDGTELVSFLHEFGHRIDYTDSRYFLADAAAQTGDDAITAAYLDFLTTARDTPTIADAYAHFRDPSYVGYFRDPKELWARAYSQWAANELGGDARKALEASWARNPHFQWSDEEFAVLAPKVEGILRARGLLL